MEPIMKRNILPLAAAVAVASAPTLAAPIAARAATLQTADLAARVDGGFVLRGATLDFHNEAVVWHFKPDGSVTGNSAKDHLVRGGMGAKFGIENAGTWRRVGNRLCIAWQKPEPRAETCQAVSIGPHDMVVLSGPKMVEGVLEAEDTGPNPNLAPASPPSDRSAPPHHRIPGAR
jgi:hypothetical protein